MRRPGLRAAMLVPLLATLVIGSAALGIFVYRAVERDLFDTIDADVTRALTAAVAPPGEPGDGERGPGPVDDLLAETETPVQVTLDADGNVVAGSPEAGLLTGDELTALAGRSGTVTIDSDPRFRARATPGPDGTTTVVALSLESVDDSLASLRRNLIVGGVVLVAVQTVVVLLVARMVSRPVARISAVAHRIREGDLDAEVPAPAGPRETAELTEDLAAMLDRLRDTIAERERAAADAERARQDMERFMADASHELRTPLTALRGYGELYRAGMLDDEGLERAMARIGNESERLGDLVGDLLQLVRPTDASTTEPVDLGAIASAVVHDLRAAHPGRSIELELDGATPPVTGDAARLHQAVLNLAANACHHTPADVPVSVRVGADGDAAVVQVVDHGPGVELAAAEELFQPFARSDAARSRRHHDGAGLGLALVRRIAADHGGSVDVSETPGGGATFELRLPTAAASRPNL